MAKTLDTFMPGVSLPEDAIKKFEYFYAGQSHAGDWDSGNRSDEYGRQQNYWQLSENMSEIDVWVVGGGEGGAGFCCCQQGTPGRNGHGVKYTVNKFNEAYQDYDCQYLKFIHGGAGCWCTTCTGHEGCHARMCHMVGVPCTNTVTATLFCSNACGEQSSSITNCSYAYNNATTCAHAVLGANWFSPRYPVTSCGTCCQNPAEKTNNQVGYDCYYCVVGGHGGFNSYVVQCCSDGICGVRQMGQAVYKGNPYILGQYTTPLGHACAQEHPGRIITCNLLWEMGTNSVDYTPWRMIGMSTAAGSGCAGGCECGTTQTQTSAWIRWRCNNTNCTG